MKGCCKMKKLISILLVAAMLFAAMAPMASATDENLPIIYIRGNGETIYDADGNVLPLGNQHRLKGAFPVSGNLDFGLSELVAELFPAMPVTGVLPGGFPVLFIAKVIIYFSFQDGFYTPLLELAQKSAKLHSSFKLLEEFPQ